MRYKYYRVESKDGYAVLQPFKTKSKALKYIQELQIKGNKKKWFVNVLSLKQYVKSMIKHTFIPDDSGKSNNQIYEEIEELEKQEKNLGHKPIPFSKLLKEFGINEESL